MQFDEVVSHFNTYIRLNSYAALDFSNFYMLVCALQCLPAINKACFTKDDKGIEETIELLKTLEAQLNDKKFFGGDSVGLVDIVANFIG